MTDSEKELVKQLRRMHEYTGLPSYNNAADAIERLVRERDEARAERDDEKAAGGPTPDNGRPLVEGADKEKSKAAAPAADPSPEVCEWTLMDKYQWSYRVACAPNPSTTYHPHPKVLAAKRCKNCNRPITFKEATK